ncbi:MAG: alpha/beta hydrolase [Caldilineaceae bacterium]
MPEFPTANGTIFYEVIEPPASPAAGQPTLTLLHNFMSTGRSAWGALLPRLAERYRLLVPDLPGHGHSVGYPAGFHYGVMAHQLAALMKAENAEHGHVAGCSAGGMIAQLLVYEGLIQPATLSLISTTYSVKSGSIEEQRLQPEKFQAGARWMEATAKLHDPYHYPGYYQQEVLAGFRELDNVYTFDLPLAIFQQWRFPVCIIHGAQDEFFPPAVAERLAAALPDAQLYIIPEQPHALIFRQPWRVLEVLMAFLP